MPTGYVKKLAKKHGVSTSTAEKHWGLAKAAAKKEGHGEDYGYVTSIFKNMMHENVGIPTLKDLTNGMTFKYFLVAEADAEAMAADPAKKHSPAYTHLSDRFPQFNELSFKARRELEKEATELLDGYDSLDQEEKDSVDDYLHDMVIDKMQSEVGQGAHMGDWKGEEERRQRMAAQAELDAQADEFERGTGINATTGEELPGERGYKEPGSTLSLGKKKRESSGPRHIAAMRQQNIPTDRAADAVAGSDEIGAPVKSYYKSWKDLDPEARAKRSGLAKKHGTIYRVKGSSWFRAMTPEQQNAVLTALKSGSDVAAAKQAGMGAKPTQH